MFRRLLPFSLCLCFVQAHAQVLSYEKSLGATGLQKASATGSSRDSVGNTYVAGDMDTPAVEKISPTGKLLWIYQVSSTVVEDGGDHVFVNQSGECFLVTGYALFALSPSGKLLWTDTQPLLIHVASLDSAGNPLISYQDPLNAANITDLSSADGSVRWSTTLAPNTVVQNMADGQGKLYLYLAGGAGSILQLNDTTGASNWAQTLSEASQVFGAGASATTISPPSVETLQVLANGNVGLVGQALAKPLNGRSYSIDYVSVLSASNGSYVSATPLLPQSGTLAGTPITLDASGNIFCCASNPNVANSVFGEELAANGTVVWKGPTLTVPMGVCQITPSPTGGAAIWWSDQITAAHLEVVDSGGNVLWTEQTPILFGESLFSDNFGVWLTGSSSFGVGDIGFAVEGYDPTDGSLTASALNTANGSIGSAFLAGVMDPQGNSYALQSTQSGETLVKLSPGGTVAWSTKVGPLSSAWLAQAVNLAYSPSGNIAVGIIGTHGIGLAEFSASTGTQRWSELLTAPTGYVALANSMYGQEAPDGLQIDSKGNPLLAYWYSANNETVLTKFSATNGSSLWRRAYSSVTPFSLVVDNADNSFVSYGTPYAVTPVGVTKVNSQGVTDWTTEYARFSNSAGAPMVLAADNAGGVFGVEPEDEPVAVVRYDASGNQLWKQEIKPVADVHYIQNGLIAEYSSAFNELAFLTNDDDGMFAGSINGTTGAVNWLTGNEVSLYTGVGMAFDSSGNLAICSTLGSLGVVMSRYSLSTGAPEVYHYAGRLNAQSANAVLVGPDNCAVGLGYYYSGYVPTGLIFKVRFQ